jgi:hypothetical protein
LTLESNSTIFEYHDFMATHGALGGAPYGKITGAGITRYNDQMFSIIADQRVRRFAIAQGVPIVFWNQESYFRQLNPNDNQATPPSPYGPAGEHTGPYN